MQGFVLKPKQGAPHELIAVNIFVGTWSDYTWRYLFLTYSEGMDKATRCLMKVYLRLGWQKLHFYHRQLMVTPYRRATILNPFLKNVCLDAFWTSSQYEVPDQYKGDSLTGLRQLWETRYLKNTKMKEECPDPRVARRMQLLKLLSRGSKDELNCYLGKPTVDGKLYQEDPVIWWRDVGSKEFPKLSQLASDLLSIPSSTSSTDQQFRSIDAIPGPGEGGLDRATLTRAQLLKAWRHRGAYKA
jgi:hypothetical protein